MFTTIKVEKYLQEFFPIECCQEYYNSNISSCNLLSLGTNIRLDVSAYGNFLNLKIHAYGKSHKFLKLFKGHRTSRSTGQNQSHREIEMYYMIKHSNIKEI